MRYIDYLKKDYAKAIKLWRERYRELTDEEWIEGVNLQMSYSGKKQWDREPDIYEVEILSIDTSQYDKERMSILDAGCGYGYLLFKFHEMGFVNLYGMDLSKICVDISQKRFSEHGIDALITEDDLSFTGYGSDSFDIITCTEVLEHDKNPLAIINEIHRVLKPGGTAYFSTPFCDRRQAWSHINYFWSEKIMEGHEASCPYDSYNVIDIYDLFHQSNFKSFFGRLIGNDMFMFVEGSK